MSPTEIPDPRGVAVRPPAVAPPRVLVCDDLHPVALEIFRERGLEPEVLTGLGEDELCATVAGAHALVVRSATRITRRVIEAAGELRVVGRAGVGVDNVDVPAATEHGVVVMNTPTGNTTTTAELAIALLCAVARHVPRADRAVRGGSWSKKGLVGTELTGKTLGVVGLGRIGGAVAKRGLGLEMRVVAHDPYLQDTGRGAPVAGVELVGLDELVAQADFVTLHVPLVDSTRDLFSAERIARMKPGAYLVNAARGGLVDEAALARALDEGRLRGAALDVLAEEPPGADHPLVGRDDVVITPHLGASSREAQYNVAADIARQIAAFLFEGVAHNAVNAPAVSARELAELAPYLALAERMGSWLAQRLEAPVRKLELTVSGEIAAGDLRPLGAALLVGALSRSVEGVNFVNAPLLAGERGVRLLEARAETSPFYTSQIKVRASSKGGEESHVVAGTVFGRHPRFVRVDELHLDLAPFGPILVTRHRDRPGVLGQVGTVLGEHGVNIRGMVLGTADPGGTARPVEEAQAFFSLDGEPDAAVLAAIAALDPIREVRLIRL